MSVCCEVWFIANQQCISKKKNVVKGISKKKEEKYPTDEPRILLGITLDGTTSNAKKKLASENDSI